MRRLVPLFACVIACVAATPEATPPPQIYHIKTTALCTRLHERVRPAVALILENDQRLAKGIPLFQKYRQAILETGSDSINSSSPQTSMTLQQMSYLVIPTARNLLAAEALLEDAKMSQPTGSSSDDATLAEMKKQLLEAIAFQNASLDLINGFVQTQQMGEIQHADEEYLNDIARPDTSSQIASATPNQWQDTTTPGLSQNPYAFDVSQVPGLAIGFNPLSRVIDGMHWVNAETAKREDAAGKTISSVLAQCQ